MTIRHSTRLWLIPLAAAWVFDLLFWQREPGVNFPIFVLLVLAAGLYLAFAAGKRPAPASWLLVPLLLVFAVMFAVRREGLTTMLNLVYSLTGLAIFSVTLLGGQWLRYSLSDYFARALRLVGGSLSLPLRYFFGKRAEGDEPASDSSTGARRLALPVLRGVLLAFPVVALLAALLASADPIFSQGLEGFLRLFRLENLGEYIFRAFYILAFGLVLMGVYLFALTRSQDEKLIGLEKPWLTPFLGSIESTVILASVDLLFAVFVAVQFRYFFGGQANIHLEGFTYAEYARRGFSELVAVACVSLGLFLGLSSITRRETARQRSLFTALGIALVLLVLVILVSAFQRLLLYEAAYGFSRVRTYTHIFMIWLGLLLIATILLEAAGRPRAFALAAVIAALGFGLSLNAVNVDAFIARQNVNRALSGERELDMAYLFSLSSDATPTLAQLFTTPGLPAPVKDRLGAVLACRSALEVIRYEPEAGWPSFNYSHYAAGRALQSVEPLLLAYPTSAGGYEIKVKINGETYSCYPDQSMD